MYELIQAAKNTYYLQSPAKIGLYVGDDNKAVLIDSGSDKEAGRKINQVLKANSWTLETIINTHSNADHVGGNAFLQDRTSCAVISTEIENAFARFPVLEPSFLYGGYPPNALRNKFLMAQPSSPSPGFVLPSGLEAIPLPGHYFGMFGVRTPDDVVFLADCLSGANIIEKYHVNFIYDVKAYLETLDMVEALQASLFIPAHAEANEDIRPLVKLNRGKVHEIEDLILRIVETPMSPDEILKAVFDNYGLTMDFNQYVLVGSTIRSFLAWLLNDGKVIAEFVENRLMWSISPKV